MNWTAALVSVSLLLVLAACRADGQEVWPAASWQQALPDHVGMNNSKLTQARDYALQGGGSGCITRAGRLVLSWGNQAQTYDLKSTTKSIGVTALGLAIKDGKMALGDKGQKYHTSLGIPPDSNAATGWLDDITLFHLATQTAGFDKSGGYTALLFAPGTKWSYSDGGPNWLAECITLAYGQDLSTLMFNRVFTPLGISSSELSWRSNAYRPDTINGIKNREFGAGISASVNAMARIGYMYLRRGKWSSGEIIPGSFVQTAGATPQAVKGLPVLLPDTYFDASNHYGLLWWNNSDGKMAAVPKDTFFSWGLYDSWIVVIPSLDIVASRAGNTLNPQGFTADYNVVKAFVEPVAQSVGYGAPYPPSTVITSLTWEPAANIIYQASGSDNWPITWGDDDVQYTAYGDGRGSDPKVPSKLSLGLAKVSGFPPSFQGTNLRSASAEQTGDGPSGKKASGMLMANGSTCGCGTPITTAASRNWLGRPTTARRGRGAPGSSRRSAIPAS